VGEEQKTPGPSDLVLFVIKQTSESGIAAKKLSGEAKVVEHEKSRLHPIIAANQMPVESFSDVAC
jgi:hypothetical protein